MVKVAVGAGGQLLPSSTAGGITEYVKAEDLERMQNEIDYGPQQQSQDEEAFDIF
jgi:penicillin-binding protein 1A